MDILYRYNLLFMLLSWQLCVDNAIYHYFLCVFDRPACGFALGYNLFVLVLLTFVL